MSKKKTVAIHQPNFFPWLGFFDKIYRSDLFVYLDHTRNNPRDPLWTKRVKIIANKAEYWLIVPLSRHKSSIFLPISEMRISNSQFRKKHLRTIEQSYGKAPFFDEIFPLIIAFYNEADPYIANRNIDFINTVCEKLEITTPQIRTSDYEWEKNGTELLIEILSRLNGTTYLCGGGAGGYQEDHKFEKAGFELIYQRFQHPSYQQLNTKDFIAGLSIVDALMNCGFNGTGALIKKSL
jgi:hypothetical protein